MSYQTLGRCSICGGEVTVPTVWMGVIPPTPTCRSCGATAVAPTGPIIPMDPPTAPGYITPNTCEDPPTAPSDATFLTLGGVLR